MSLSLVCPACRARLLERDGEWGCSSCGRRFPVHQGIPDLRLEGDGYLSLAQDRDRADQVVAALEGRDLRGVLEHYWSLSAETPLPLRRRFVAGALRASLRAAHWVHRLRGEGLLTPATRVLEVGSGTAAFLAEAAPHCRELIGLDLALRWLHVGRRRLLDAGLEAPPLLAASGEALPFEDGRFDLVVCLATLEFVGNPGRLLDESARVLRPGGSLVLSTVNRFSLGKEPHVDLWGVGFLPRTWQGGYVRARGRGDSWGLRLFSFRELIRLARARFATVRLEPAELPEALALTPAGRLALRTYDRMRTLPFARGLLRRIGPEWDACFVKA